jgi:conjugative relaxase-like TrwC/TraI family protein
MLGIRRIGAGRADYYLSDLAAEVPLERQGAAGRWVGSAAEGLGLDAAAVAVVDPERFRSLLTEGPVRSRIIGHGVRVAAYDLTFSAPKSASVVFALGGEETARSVVRAHAAAVDGALRYLERHGLGAVRSSGGGEREVIETTGFAGAAFTHGVNRNLDPHLHSHVVVVNAVHGVDGRWSAIDGRGLDAHRRAAGAVYEAHLRDALTASLGVRWEGPPGRSLEIATVAPALRGEFSSRGADVRMHAYEAGVRSARGQRVAWAATRPPKVTGTPYEELAVDWRRRADSVGLGVEAERGGRVPRGAESASFDEHRFAGVISLTPHGGAHRRDVVGAFAVAARDGVAAASLERAADLWAPGGRVGVAEERLTRRSVVPAPHVVAALGPRPLDPAGHATWVGAARAIDAYRGRWGIRNGAEVEPLGVGRNALSSLPPAQLADHLRVTRQLDAARQTLGRRAPAELELGLGR